MPIRRFTSDEAAASALREALAGMYPALVVFFRKRLPAHWYDGARDLAQETLLAAFAAVSRTDGDEVRDLTQYVLGIARKKASDALRDEYRRRTVTLDEVGDQHFLSRMTEITAERQLYEAEWRAKWMRALRKLRPVERDILRLRFIERMGNSEACHRLGIPPEEGSRLKYRALEKLRFLLRVKKRDRTVSPLRRL
jgi:RNA polymerase sigma factor (sigma-70 family)